MQAADDCVFCRLIAGELDASVVYEDRRTVALMDIQPLTFGHVLVMPRTHSPSLEDLDPDDGAQMFRVAKMAAAALRHSGLRCDGVNLFLADGAAAGQDVFHVICMPSRGSKVTALVCDCRPTTKSDRAPSWMPRRRRCGKPGPPSDIRELWRSPQT